jgi:hypothetical protein
MGSSGKKGYSWKKDVSLVQNQGLRFVLLLIDKQHRYPIAFGSVRYPHRKPINQGLYRPTIIGIVRWHPDMMRV